MVALAVIATIVAGLIGGMLGAAISFPQLGVVAAIAVMGGFIMAENKKGDEQ